MPVLLVVSFAGLNAPHRKAFDLLAKRFGWQVHLCVPAAIPIAGAAAKQCDGVSPDAAYTLHPTPIAAPSSARLSWFRGLVKLARRVRPDVVFVEYDPGSLVVMESFFATLGLGSKVVSYTVENVADERWSRARENLRRRQVRAAARDAFVGTLHALGRLSTDAIACLNDDGQRIYRDQWGWSQPTEVVPLGTDLELFFPRNGAERRAELGFTTEDFVVGYFGRLISEKRVHTLIEALAKLPPHVKLLLDMFRNFEPGSYAASLIQRAEQLGVRQRVVTVDVPHGQVAASMVACDVIALPSTETPTFKEQFGRVLPEAMACGVPVIATDTGYLPVIVGDAGLVIPRESLEDLVAAVQRLVDSPELSGTLRDRGLARVRERWSVDVQVELLNGLFRRLI